MSRPRGYTRTVLFAETFDFPTPPTWDRQSMLDARRSAINRSCSPPPLPYPLEPADSWQAVQQAAASEHLAPSSPVQVLPAATPSSPALCSLDNKQLQVYSDARKRSRISHESQSHDVEPWSPHQYRRQQDHEDRQQLQEPQQWPCSHPHAPSPDCPCCSPHFTSRWSICSDDSRPPSPSTSIHKRLRKMASSSTLRSVRSSIRLRLKTSLLQLTRRH